MADQLYRKITYPSGKVRYEPVLYIPTEALSEGVWLVQKERDGCRRQLNLSYLFDLPPAPDQVAWVRRIDDIANAICKAWDLYREKGSQSPMEVAEMIIKELASENGDERR